MKKTKNYKFETLQLHVGQERPDASTRARAVPIYQTSSFVFEDCDQAARIFDLKEEGNIYTRIMNPTNDIFEKRIAALEGGTGALATASGAAAITLAVQTILSAGDHIVSQKTIYGGTYNLFLHTFKKMGIETTFVDADDISNFEKAMQDNTKLVFIESLGNPNSDIVDIEEIAKIAHKHGVPLMIDSTFASPYLLRPIEYGADIVVHSATKYICGHGTTIGGVIIDGGNFDWEMSGKFPCLVEPDVSYHNIEFTKAVGNGLAYITRCRVSLLRDTGACLSPFNAFLLLQGTETLSLRVERHIENGLKVAEFLEGHPNVLKVNHPGLNSSSYNRLYKKYFPKGAGSIFSFEIKGGKEKAKEFISKLDLFSLLANVADVKSLVIHPASTTHSQMNERELEEVGIKPGTIRLSIGTEHIDDIIDDLKHALE